MMSALAEGKAATMKQAANSNFRMVVPGDLFAAIKCAKPAKNKSKLRSAGCVDMFGFHGQIIDPKSSPSAPPPGAPWPAAGWETVPACPACGDAARELLHGGLRDRVFF